MDAKEIAVPSEKPVTELVTFTLEYLQHSYTEMTFATLESALSFACYLHDEGEGDPHRIRDGDDIVWDANTIDPCVAYKHLIGSTHHSRRWEDADDKEEQPDDGREHDRYFRIG